ncbi:hypothetical protein [Bradyrhizobium erythrophlei]|uniref:Uncharacterized protein n=1 Tax=Bradyrhizobium erythrophlei TaxID=1437360 RepID=A0A1M5PUC0_9BRAD|nr:hypothetical protein [Bradyrhizobium erythrophlei]SHH05079.1 hypothetical protein SAMN05443248_3503 [Bradyrhizobium erythrophlei]
MLTHLEVEEMGARARRAGVPINMNPITMPAMRPFWDTGWIEEDAGLRLSPVERNICDNLRDMIEHLPDEATNDDLLAIHGNAGGMTDIEVCAFVDQLLDDGWDWEDVLDSMLVPVRNAA